MNPGPFISGCGNKMIEAKQLTKKYGSFEAIRNLSFCVNPGEIVGLLGPNGAGKSTTMRILTGFMPPTIGNGIVAGFDVAESPLEVKKRVGYLPESVPLYLEMTVRAFLNYVSEIKGVPRRERSDEVGRVCALSGLEKMIARPIGHLSKGYRQRVGLAQALVGSPPVLVLDEPTVGLDPAQIIEIREMIRALAGDHTILLSTHILPEVQMICDRAIIINHGRIVAEETLASLNASDRTLEEIFVSAVSGEHAIDDRGSAA